MATPIIRSKSMTKISHGLEFAAFWLLTRLAQLMPSGMADRVAVILGKTAHRFLKSRVRIAEDNLKRAFGGQLDRSDRERLVPGIFINIARTTIDFARQPVLSRDRVLKLVPEHSGLEYIDEALSKGRGLVFLSAHFGSWELIGIWLHAMGYPVDFLVGQQHNPYVDRLFNHFRTSHGISVIPVGVSARHVLKSLKNNRIVAFLGDQHAASGAAVVDFFGRPAATARGAAAFALKSNCPIILGLLVREAYNRHRAVIQPPIYPPEDGNRDEIIVKMTQAHTAQLEKVVRQYPAQWMWTHRRWKVDRNRADPIQP